MLNTKLILVDGITGSGKSTTAHFIARQLEKNGVKVKWFHEQEKDHPLHNKVGTSNEEEYLNEIIKSFYNQLTEFVEQIVNDDTVYILESFLFQDIVLPFVANACSKEEILNFYSRYYGIIAKTNPVLIHFYQQDTAAALREMWDERGGEEMKKMYIEQTETAFYKYCKSRNLQGEPATISFWDEIVNISKELFDTFSCHKIQIDNTLKDWDFYRKQYLNFLQVEQFEEKLFDETYKEYCGFYGGLIIHSKNNRLCANWFWPDSKLIQLTTDVFEFEGWPIVIEFLRNDNNNIKSLKFLKVNRHAEVGEEKLKITEIELSDFEKQQFCGSYHCESDKLDRIIYLKDNIIYYRRNESSESILIPTSPTELVMQGGGAKLFFDINDEYKQFTITTKDKPDLLFIKTNS